MPGHPAGGYHFKLHAKLFPNPPNHAVNAAGIAIEHAAFHAVNGIASDEFFWRIEANLGKLRSTIDQRIQCDAKWPFPYQ